MKTRAEQNRQPLLDNTQVIYELTGHEVSFSEAVREINFIQDGIWKKYPETRVTGEVAATRQMRRALGVSATWGLWRDEKTTESTRLALLCQSIVSGVLGYHGSGLGFSLEDTVRAAEEPPRQNAIEATEKATKKADRLDILQKALLAFIDRALAADEVGRIHSHNFEWIMDTLREVHQPHKSMQPIIDKLQSIQVQWNYWYDIDRYADVPHPVANYLFDKRVPSELRPWLLETAQKDVDFLNDKVKNVPETNVVGWNHHLKVLLIKIADADYDPLRHHARQQLNTRHNLAMPIEDNDYWAWKRDQQEAQTKKEEQDKEKQKQHAKEQKVATKEAEKSIQERIAKESRDLVAAAHAN